MVWKLRRVIFDWNWREIRAMIFSGSFFKFYLITVSIEYSLLLIQINWILYISKKIWKEPPKSFHRKSVLQSNSPCKKSNKWLLICSNFVINKKQWVSYLVRESCINSFYIFFMVEGKYELRCHFKWCH
jgi:hypothetical protein